MRRPTKWIGILVLALTVVSSQASTASAGVIPWMYHTIFGPVGHGYGGYGYSPYGYGPAYRSSWYSGQQVGYFAPPTFNRPSNYSTAGCTPCVSNYGTVTRSTQPRAVRRYPTFAFGFGYAPANYGYCRPASCATISSNNTCQPKTVWTAQEGVSGSGNTNVSQNTAPTAADKDAPPQPTYADKVVVTKETEAVEKTKVEPTVGLAGFEETAREGDPDAELEFHAPRTETEGPIEESTAPAALPLEDEDLLLKLQTQCSWKYTVPAQRIAFQARFRNARIVRSSNSIKTDYIIPAAATLRMVSR